MSENPSPLYLTMDDMPEGTVRLWTVKPALVAGVWVGNNQRHQDFALHDVYYDGDGGRALGLDISRGQCWELQKSQETAEETK